MTETTNDEARRRELRRARRLLKELASLSDHASLTGSLRGGAVDAASAFNQVLAFAAGQGIELRGLVSPLPDDASFDRIGVASRLLRAVLDDELCGDEERDVRVMVSKTKHLDELGRIHDIGAVLREHLPDFLKGVPGEGHRAEVHVETRDENPPT